MPDSESFVPGRGGCGILLVDGPAEVFTRRLAGLSPAGRLARQLYRLGVPRILVRCERQCPSAAWMRQVPRGLEVVVVEDDGLFSADVREIPAGAVYSTEELKSWLEGGCGADLKPDLLLNSETSWEEAEARIWLGANKSLEHDGVVAYFVGRPLARLFSRLLVSTPVSPNQVTVVSALVGLAGAGAAAMGTYWGFVFGAFLYWFGMVVDCVDGDLARVRIEGSRLGQWLDSVADDLSTAAFTAGMGLGLSRAGVGVPWSWIGGNASWWHWVGPLAALALVVAQTHVYRGLVHAGLPIDTAKYPWFFLGDQGVVRSQPGIATYLGHAVRRDFSSAAYTVLCLVGLAPLVGVACVVGGMVVFLLAALDAAVKTAGASVQAEAD